ncbi:MAG TPA: WbqC family protein [Bacteroidales bacterium]|nr:WbqC family protein [Bacteroidales bacterium]
MGKNILLSTAYLPPIVFFQSIGGSNISLLDDSENYQKQSYRNRTVIYAPNGPQTLIIPIVRPYNIPVKDVKIEYHTPWQRNHWRSLTTAYNNSPYFEFYQDLFSPFYSKKTQFLFDFNNELIQMILKLLRLNKTLFSKNEYPDIELLSLSQKLDISPKKSSQIQQKPYSQVYNDKFGFIENLSIVDLLFNIGPHATEYVLLNSRNDE